MTGTNRQKANAIVLLEGATTSGGYCEVAGGNYQLVAECATWNGASVALQFKAPNGTAVTVAGASISANGTVAVEITDGAEVKAIVTGTPSAGIYARLERIDR